MDVPQATLDILKCGVCGVQLSRGPVYLQHDGAALCGPCFTPEKNAFRNVHYEALAQLHIFPCKYKSLGCKETVSFVQASELIPHEEMCEHRECACPVLGSARCDWLGPRANLLKHYEDQHPELLLQNPCTLQHDITKTSEKTYLLRWLQVLFLLHVKVSVAAGKIYHSVRYLGRTEDSKSFWYNLHIKRKNETIKKESEAAPEGCLAIQEDTSLSLDINSLLSVLGGFDGTTFTIEVHRRVRGATQGALRACKNQALGCNHQDVDSKCRKHEDWFCEEGIQCGVCCKARERDSLYAHRSSACKAVCGVGSTWRPRRGSWQWCLVSGAAGTAVCRYILYHALFELSVFIPVSSERLREFRCVVRVTQPATGQVRTYTPDLVYDKRHDWYVKLEKTEFLTWDYVFDVSVDITEILV